MQSQHVLEKTEKLTTSIFRQNGQPFFAELKNFSNYAVFSNAHTNSFINEKLACPISPIQYEIKNLKAIP